MEPSHLEVTPPPSVAPTGSEPEGVVIEPSLDHSTPPPSHPNHPTVSSVKIEPPWDQFNPSLVETEPPLKPPECSLGSECTPDVKPLTETLSWVENSQCELENVSNHQEIPSQTHNLHYKLGDYLQETKSLVIPLDLDTLPQCNVEDAFFPSLVFKVEFIEPVLHEKFEPLVKIEPNVLESDIVPSTEVLLDRNESSATSSMNHIEPPQNHTEVTCEFCSRCFKEKAHLEMHMSRSHSDLALYQCAYCTFQHSFKSVVQNHHRLAHNDRVRKDKMQIRFAVATKPSDQIKSWTPEFIETMRCCHLCRTEQFPSVDDQEKHYLTYHGINAWIKFQIDIYTRAMEAIDLARRSSAKRGFKCYFNDCKTKHMSRSTLRSHLNVCHLKLRRFSCGYCTHLCCKQHDMENHMSQKHPNLSPYGFREIEEINQLFARFKQVIPEKHDDPAGLVQKRHEFFEKLICYHMNQHKLDFHGEQLLKSKIPKVNKCPIIDGIPNLSYDRFLVKHFNQFHGSSLKCGTCEYSFMQGGSEVSLNPSVLQWKVGVEQYRKERVGREAERGCECGLCNMKYLTRSHLHNHTRQAHVDINNTLQCSACDKNFPHKHRLEVHWYKHHGESEPGFELKSGKVAPSGVTFPCSYCPAVLTNERLWDEHVVSYHPIREWCGACHFTCTERRLMEMHERVRHFNVSKNSLHSFEFVDCS